MTKLAFLVDCHLACHKKMGGPVKSSLNRRCRQALDALAQAIDYAATEECDALFILGDLFDTTRPSPQLIAETMRVLTTGSMSIVLIPGNHDQVSFADDDNALAPLPFSSDAIRVVEKPEVITVHGGKKSKPVHVLCIPFHPGRTTDWLPGVLKNTQWDMTNEAVKGKRPVRGRRILAMHQGIRHQGTSEFLRKSEDAIDVSDLASLVDVHDLEHVFAGHWHDHFWEKDYHIMQIGALVPTGFDNPGLEGYGNVALWDNGGVALESVSGPRFLKLGSLAKLDESRMMHNDTYISVGASAEDARHVRDELDLLVESDVIIDGEVMIETAAVEKAARDAANAARSTETLDEALIEYVAKMPLADGVDRAAVLAKTQEYLRGDGTARAQTQGHGVKVCKLTLSNHFCHKSTEVVLPPVGIVVVLGANESGKSLLLESVATACWGETLRGAPPFSDDGPRALVGVQLDGGLEVARSKSPRGSPKLRFSVDGHEEKFGSTTKAQEALDALIEPFDVWRRAHAFSSADASHFSLASDKARKQLVETLVGIGGSFDGALKECRADLKVASDELNTCEKEVLRIEQQLAAERRRLDENRAALKRNQDAVAGLTEDSDVVEEPLGEIEEQLARTTKKVEKLTAMAHVVDMKTIAHDGEVGLVRRRIEALDSDACPTCGQDIPASLVEQLTDKARVMSENAEEVRADGLEEKEDIVSKLRDLQETKRGLEQRVRSVSNACSRLEVQDRNLKTWRKNIAACEATVADAERNIKRLTVELDGARDEEEMIAEDVAVLTACAKVLGLKGVRAQVLGRALGGLEAVANMWLQRLACEGMRVHLSPCRELKDGGISDEVSFEVERSGNRHGYKAVNGGHRRRVDVALLLAFAEVAAAGHGKSDSTLFFDEVFDCLDAEGTAAVARALEDLAARRCVVVITHSPRLAEELSAAKTLRVENGKVLDG